MSYQRFAKEELKRANTEPALTNLVLTLLDLSETNEFSGGAMMVYHDYIRGVIARGAVDHLPDNLKPAFANIDITTDEGKATVANAMFLFNALIAFEPLTPLTGDDDEWIDVSRESGETMYQNARMSTVFKNKDGAYRIGHTLFAYPTRRYDGWHQITRSNQHSSQQVTFPYDVHAPENQIRVRYFVNESWLGELPTGVEPHAWLRWLRERYLLGIDPTTNKIREDVMFVEYDDIERLTKMLRNLLCYVKYTEGQPLEAVKDKLDWLYQHQEQFELEWTEPEMEGSGTIKYKSVFTNSRQAGRLLRLLELIPQDIDYMVGSEDSEDAPFFIDRDHNEYHLCFVNVFTPTNYYRGWVHGGRYVLMFAKRDEELEPFSTDNGYQVLGDADDYLYQKRREHGYAHPRGRNTAHYVVPDQVRAIDVQEGEQIDNAVTKHVKHVFGTNKKD